MYSFLGVHFSRWVWLLAPLRKIIGLTVHPEYLNKEKLHTELRGKDVIVVLPHMSLLDILIINTVLKSFGLTPVTNQAKPQKGHKEKETSLKTQLLCIRRAGGILNLWSPSDAFSRDLSEIIKKDKRVRSNNLIILPISVFWGRSSDRLSRSVWLKALFPESSEANALQKLILFFLHRGNVHVYLSQPMNFFTNNDDKNEKPLTLTDHDIHDGAYDLARRLRRMLLIEFKRERTAALGPALYEFQNVANFVLNSQETRQMIHGAAKPQKEQNKALRYLQEIAANYNSMTVRALEKTFDFVFTRIFRGIRVRNFEAVVNAVRTGQILWVPCHRSHIDYLLLSCVLFKRGLVPPHIVAGVNLSFWPAGPILRRGGAFFIRRSFGGNKLYAHIFSQYVHYLMHNSFPIEFFHEGGRSRIGKLLSPKLGMMSMCMTSVLQRRASNTLIIPVYISYDKVMEDDSYASEIKGKKKEKESIWQLIKALPHLLSNLGRVDVSFGNPIHVGQSWTQFFSLQKTQKLVSEEEYPPVSITIEELDPDFDGRSYPVQLFCKHLARQVNQGINSAATASSSALLCALLLAKPPQQNTTEQDLCQWVLNLGEVVTRIGKKLNWQVTALASEESWQLEDSKKDTPDPTLEADSAKTEVKLVIDNAKTWGWIQFKSALDDTPPLLIANKEKEINLWWYRGTIFHVLAIVGLCAWLSQTHYQLNGDTQLGDDRVPLLNAMRGLWDEELYWPDSTPTQDIWKAGVEILVYLGVCEETVEGGYKVNPKSLDMLGLLSRFVLPELEVYGVVLACSLHLVDGAENFAKDQLLALAKQTHRAAFMTGVATYPPTLTGMFFQRVFDAFCRKEVFERQGNKWALAPQNLEPLKTLLPVSQWNPFLPQKVVQ